MEYFMCFGQVPHWLPQYGQQHRWGGQGMTQERAAGATLQATTGEQLWAALQLCRGKALSSIEAEAEEGTKKKESSFFLSFSIQNTLIRFFLNCTFRQNLLLKINKMETKKKKKKGWN